MDTSAGSGTPAAVHTGGPPEECDGGIPDPAETELCFTEEHFTDLEDMVISDDLHFDMSSDTYEAALRLRTDRLLLEELVACGFTGSLHEAFRNELARYGMDVLTAWIRSGKIARLCRERGRPTSIEELRTMQWGTDELSELAIETVAHGIRYFYAEVLHPGRWKPERKATLKTFFVGSCVLQFPNAYRRWLRDSYQWRQMVDSAGLLDDLHLHGGEDDQTAPPVISRLYVDHLLERVTDPQTRAAAHLVSWGYTYAEAGEQVGLSERAVEGRFRRIRAKPHPDPTETLS
ncbi:RNA polymerase sigma factor [Streptomyces neyagawaensis]|uniref:RNA polymerase sigma factor n=1 Tax=Streptomyces neyagawaensis TaxID=42238 RepID=UPI0006E1CE06|nr:sigma-70 family RNA polymerase sigma factor [Streptomyces neyagawaensis]MCL6737419.1 sigma-70 family RNA polymerase sigma factor [Streptomyces neyagawaensis]